jgi:phenylacetate-CoA ligase
MTPEALNFLVKYMESNHIKTNRIQAINTTGSVLTNTTRIQAESIFGCKIFDGFSCEGGAVVFECPTHNYYHSAMEYAITEVLDNNDKPVNKGRLITTDLWNYATPFIRYDTQDIVELGESNCSCGRELLTIKQIFGRSSDVLVTPKGKYLIVNNFTGLFQEIKEIEQFQVFQKEIDHFIVNIKVNENYNNEINHSVYELCKKIINEDVRLEIIIVDNIPVETSGKRRFLIRNQEILLP